MTDISKIHCVGCEGGIEPLTESTLLQKLESLPGWEYQADKKRLRKKFEFKGFMRTMSFVNAIAWIANTEKHHPDLEVSYNCCIVHYQTHAVDGVTENDLICARKVEALLD